MAEKLEIESQRKRPSPRRDYRQRRSGSLSAKFQLRGVNSRLRRLFSSSMNLWGKMKRFRGWVTSFVVGFALFIAGAAVANETDLGSSEEVASASEETAQVEEQVVEADEGSAAEGEPVEIDENLDSVSEEDTLVVGGDTPPEQDNCVEGEVSNMQEVDCLIANGIVPASDRETYMYHLGILEPQQVFSIPDTLNPYNPVFCYEIGKSNELDGDCYCVNGEISDLREVDCLMASRLLAPETRQGYISYFEATR